MAAPRLATLLSPATAWVDSKGHPYPPLIQFMTAIASSNIGPLPSAVNDAAAAKAGVPINGLYQNAGALRIRLS